MDSWYKPQAVGPRRKVLVASRGEAALRVFRTLREIEIESIGIYAHEDRFSQHRQIFRVIKRVGKA
ncbi:hypothetical protein ANCCAN_13631 [Ancylostoma caninum]|uniref:Biotin carboxylation domain-containing protein n=1 Tax=Ancylostoma caninum TaxID=29170 RepID=A0A368GBN7_ANCCA|nr:hypothetical protein ANCCAN_13631 [Ancylostoma caninum]